MKKIVVSSFLCLALLGCQVEQNNKAILTIEPSDQEPVAVEKNYASAMEALTSNVLTGSTMARYLESGVLEIGLQDAPHTLVVFTEYHCGYCWNFFNTHLKKLEHDFIVSGILKVQIIPVILEKYPNSSAAARGLLCAGRMGQGKQMHEILLSRKNRHRSSILEYARELALDETKFTTCFDGEEVGNTIAIQEFIIDKVDAKLVPTFILDGEKKVGLPLYADMRGWVESKIKMQN